MSPDELPAAQEQLSELFGSYKAEWLREQIFDFFTVPAYFPELKTARPCVLVGGRGTGKTTVLRSLSYEGELVLRGRDSSSIPSWPYYGLYLRVNTNRVSAFKGPELDEPQWIRLFGHYMNLVICGLGLRFLTWYGLRTDTVLRVDDEFCAGVTASLHLKEASDLPQLARSLELARIRFEAYVNNVADGGRPPLSMQGAPIDDLFASITALPQFRDKHFFILVDEYENFEDYQQRVLNSLIKHSGPVYTFKVGVRELGFRQRTTLNENEQLISPADYVRINITEKLDGEIFRSFASSVCNARLSRLVPGGRALEIEELLPGLTEDEEATLLGAAEAASHVKTELLRALGRAVEGEIDRLQPLQLVLIKTWAESNGEAIQQTLRNFLAHPAEWDTRYANYKHALLYTSNEVGEVSDATTPGGRSSPSWRRIISAMLLS